MNALIITVAVVLVLLLAVVAWGISTYNGLVRRRTVVAEAWSGIETQLKRRADLIPNLIETVKGYAGHERKALEELTRLRALSQTQADPAARAQTESSISALLGRVMVVGEAYPDLKASANFQSLQGDLANTEDQIQLARRYYNGCVRELNVMIDQMPSGIVAQAGGFNKAEFFEIDEAAERALPRVSFAS